MVKLLIATLLFVLPPLAAHFFLFPDTSINQLIPKTWVKEARSTDFFIRFLEDQKIIVQQITLPKDQRIPHISYLLPAALASLLLPIHCRQIPWLRFFGTLLCYYYASPLIHAWYFTWFIAIAAITRHPQPG